MDINSGLVAIGAGLALGLSGLGVGVGQGVAVGHALSAIGRNPAAEGKIKSTMFIGLGITESAVIYGLIIALILVFTKM
ncbi:MAG: ATP synthase F0 subunit C [Mycoplasmatales bacterium]